MEKQITDHITNHIDLIEKMRIHSYEVFQSSGEISGGCGALEGWYGELISPSCYSGCLLSHSHIYGALLALKASCYISEPEYENLLCELKLLFNTVLEKKRKEGLLSRDW